MKQLAIVNCDKPCIKRIVEIITAKKLFGVTLEITGDMLTPEVIELSHLYNVNLLIRIDCVEHGPYSVENYLASNPDFENVMNSLSAEKTRVVIYTSSPDHALGSIYAVACSFNRFKTIVTIGENCESSYYMAEQDYHNGVGESLLTNQVEGAALNHGIKFTTHLGHLYDILDYNALSARGLLVDTRFGERIDVK